MFSVTLELCFPTVALPAKPSRRQALPLVLFVLQLLSQSACARPVAAGVRAGVLTRLFPSATELLSTPLVPASFTQKRQAALRWRKAQARSTVQRAQREIEALESLPSLPDALDGDAAAELVARRARIAELRREAGVAEGRIILLRTRQHQMGIRSRLGWFGDGARFLETFLATEERSARVLLSLLARQRDPWNLVREDTASLLRLGSQPALLAGYMSLRDADLLAPHAAAIAARAAKLERYAPGILLAVDGHLGAIEPHLDAILERLDQIEPHLPFVLKHLDTLAPHCGALLKHIDALLLYADDGGKYLEPLLPYVPRFAPLLDQLGPHLALLRPHMRRLLPHMPVVAPSAHRYARQLAVSGNADVLLYYFGWVLRIRPLGAFVLRLPFMPRLAAFLATRLWRRPVRGRTCDYYCDWEGCDLAAFTSEKSAASSGAYCSGLWADSYESKRQRIRATSALLRRIRET